MFLTVEKMIKVKLLGTHNEIQNYCQTRRNIERVGEGGIFFLGLTHQCFCSDDLPPEIYHQKG